MSATVTAMHDAQERLERVRAHLLTAEQRLHRMPRDARQQLDPTRWPGESWLLHCARAHLEHASHAMMLLSVYVEMMARHEEHQQMEVMP